MFTDVEVLESRRLLAAFAVKVNFQPEASSPPSGFRVDYGAAYALRSNGFTYGWSADNRANARERNASVAQEYDTLNHFQRSASLKWEIAVPNGQYRVRVVAGDPSFFNDIQKLSAETAIVTNATTTSAKPFVDGTVTVYVTDGRLTLAPASGSRNAKINFAEITQIVQPTSTFAVKVNFQPETSTPPGGFRVDYGATYALRSNGFSYGWSTDNRSNARERNTSVAQEYDTLNHFQRTSTALKWEIAVPSGQYRVRIVAGDPSFFNDIQKIAAESTVVTNATTSSSKPFIDGTATLNVTDGRLTLAPAAGSRNAKINFAEITRIGDVPTAPTLQQKIATAVSYAETALARTLNDIGNNANIFVHRTGSDGKWKTTDANAWTAGFLAGSMWQLNALTGKTSWRDQATKWTLPLASQTNNTGDLAFKFFTTYLPLYEKTQNPAYRQVLLDAAASKNRQWNETVGAFRTDWFTTRSGNPRANFAVLMDMTTDMELMLWASRETGNTQYRDRAIAHTEKVIANQIRADGGISQFAMYDAANGEFFMQETYQGYSNSSAWSRGQAWAILSLTAIARDTGRADFLAAAQKVADYYLSHLPSDFVPYWDFNHPQIPNTFRDSSAAAVAASGLLELSRILTNAGDKARYRTAAENTINSLIGPAYWAQGSVHRGLLLHGASNVPNDQFGRDSSLIYGDYYLLKSMSQYLS